MTKKIGIVALFLFTMSSLEVGCLQQSSSERSSSVKEPNYSHSNNGLSVGFTEQTIARTTHALVDMSTYEKKVDRAVAFYRQKLHHRPKSKPLIMVLGGSSTGGMSNQGYHFWPAYLQRNMPKYHIQSISVGGATTWHLAKTVQRLGVHAEYCILYAKNIVY